MARKLFGQGNPMDEFFRTSENQRYAENYRCEEYNRVTEDFSSVENFRTSETNAEKTESASSSSARSSDKKQETAKRNLLSSSVMLPAVGTVAGAAVIFAAVVAVIKVVLLSVVVSAGVISAAFSVENIGGAVLTAYLVGGGESYSQTLSQSGDKYLVDFRLLDPDTEYALDVRDGDGKSHFSATYRTASYEERLVLLEGGSTEAGMMYYFDGNSLLPYDCEVYIDKIPAEAALSAENPVLRFSEVEPYVVHDLRITDKVSGELLFMREFETAGTVWLQRDTFNSRELRGTFAAETLPEGEFGLYVDGELLPQTVSATGSTRFVVDGLWAGRVFELELRDKATGKTVYRESYTAPDIVVEIESEEVAPESAGFVLNLQSSAPQSVFVRLYDSTGRIVSFEAIDDVRDSFAVTFPIDSFPDSIRPNGTYELVVEYNRETDTNYETEAALRHTFVTPSYMEPDSQYVAGGETTSDGKNVALLKRVPDEAGLSVSVTRPPDYDDTTSSLQLRCFSENGLTLPLDEYGTGELSEYTHAVFTQYAKSGEIYVLELSGMDVNGETRVFETRYFRIADGETEVEYPDFAVSLAPGETEGAYVLTMECANATALTDANGESVFTVTVLNGDGSVYWSGVSDDFAAESVQVVAIPETTTFSSFTVTFEWAYGESAPGLYTVGSVTAIP